MILKTFYLSSEQQRLEMYFSSTALYQEGVKTAFR